MIVEKDYKVTLVGFKKKRGNTGQGVTRYVTTILLL